MRHQGASWLLLRTPARSALLSGGSIPHYSGRASELQRTPEKQTLALSLSVYTNDMYLSRDLLPLQMASFVLEADTAEETSDVVMTSTTTSSDESFAQASRWIEHCRLHHKVCNADKSMWFPTRLIYIGDGPNGNDDIRLIHTAVHPPATPYATLSHRWGQAHVLQLLHANIDSFQQGIPASGLPRTFREALLATRKLGVQYIWIDSLCIIQDRDDLSDWHKEATLMHKVYSNSYCNLAASDAKDSTEGLFRDRDPRSLQSRVNLCMEGLDDQQAYLPVTFAESDLWARAVPWSSINRRGWVFQERMLSPRILYFGHEQLFWECRELEATESYPTGLPALIDTQGPGGGLKIHDPMQYLDHIKRKGGHFEQSWDVRDAMANMWSDMVEAYTSCALTMPQDKLIALSGIAQQLQTVFNDEYIAGMWRSRLVINLGWRRNPRSTGTRAAEYRAPTWSWACIDGIIMIPPYAEPGFVFATVDSVRLEHATDGVTTGNLTAGSIELRGVLRRLDVAERRGTGWETKDGLSLNPVELDAEQQDTVEGLPVHPVFGMALFRYNTDNDLSVLLLEQLSHEMGLYRRVGLASIRDNGHIARFLDSKEAKILVT
ncbi:heterokaryon incompatibility protein-domain-containing protein [Microdochium bolleyi]|uniref:Heterokaryon incompatibility protein-domain-containing protein n=1 Tax=Microdochium bolleyi TaxID=196109 RepID=A0A136JGJ7_9PEZI|nr:heterokaryon incompatibility protein-domain-containing protein [Microdochium bolleyi]